MVKDHPYPFILVFLLGILVAYIHYQERISILKERISGYQERVGETPKETAYQNFSHQDLKIQLQRLGQELRGFQQQVREENRQRYSRYDQQRNAATSDAERQRIYQEEKEEADKSLVQHQPGLQQFVPKIQALSSEVQTRLPRLQKQIDEILLGTISASYTFSGVDPIGSVADFIDKLAALLPSKRPNWFSLRWQDTLFTVAVFIGVFFWALRQYALWYRPKPSPSISVSRETNSTIA